MGVGIFRTTKGFDISKEDYDYSMDDIIIIDDGKNGVEQNDNRLERISEDDDDEDSGNETNPDQVKKVSISEEVVKIDLESNAVVQPKPLVLSKQSSVPDALKEPLPQTIKNFSKKIKKATIDVWWLYDDGGEA